jgi:hypothetical protein
VFVSNLLFPSFVFKKDVGRDGKISKCRGPDDGFLIQYDCYYDGGGALLFALRCGCKPHIQLDVRRRFQHFSRHTLNYTQSSSTSTSTIVTILPEVELHTSYRN